MYLYNYICLIAYYMSYVKRNERPGYDALQNNMIITHSTHMRNVFSKINVIVND